MCSIIAELGPREFLHPVTMIKGKDKPNDALPGARYAI